MAEIIPPRRDELLTPDGLPTTRFSEYLELITGTTNTNTAAVNVRANLAGLSRVLALEERLGSGDELTWDETGFTWDSDKLSFDQDEA